MIASPLPAAAEAWFLSGEFFSPGAAKGPFVQPGRGGGRARRPIPADDQWSRATAFSVSRSPSLSLSRLFPIPLCLSLPPLSLFIFLLGRDSPCLPLSLVHPRAYLISASYLPYSPRRRILVLISTTRRKRERISLPLFLPRLHPSPPPLPPSSYAPK